MQANQIRDGGHPASVDPNPSEYVVENIIDGNEFDVTPFQRAHIDPDEISQTYEVGEMIGRGSFAKVFQARHIESNKYVALKVLEKALLSQDEQ